MLDIKRIRENFDEVVAGERRRNNEAYVELVKQARDLDVDRRRLLNESDALKTERNTRSKEIGQLKKAGQDTTEVQAEVRKIGDAILEKDAAVREIEAKLQEVMLRIPNVPNAEIPDGPDASGNVVVRTIGKKPEFDFKPLDHLELGTKLGIFDLERAAKITGTGFPMLVGVGSHLQRALIQYMLDLHTEKQGYTEVLPPFVVNSDSMRGTGQLPKMAEDMYHCEVDDYWLVPTAEVPVTNIYRDEILTQPLPIYLTAYTPCFRREAGSAGKDTRGIKRVHQFDKVEMVKFVEPETSYDELEKLVQNAGDVLEGLGLYYHVLKLCTGDISFSCAKCYDLELWAPAHEEWLEVSSCSNFEDFQARRLNCRYRGKDGKPRLVHTLNGSGVALPRLMIALLEQCQQADGSVLLPEAIWPYMRGIKKLEPIR
ncbi:MAG: serine--tRNA ligase [Kiritimatiellae bacterium]|nr:serine--tRNA ligase [Kiritimatiellia bacterium]